MADKKGIYSDVSLGGMRDTLVDAISPTDAQFSAMEKQGKALREGLSLPSGSWGFGESRPAIYNQSLPRAAQPTAPSTFSNENSAGVDSAGAALKTSRDTYNQPSTGDIPQADLGTRGPMRGVQVTNTYDQDRPASMSASNGDPWKDMSRQLATFSAMRAQGAQPQGGVGIVGDVGGGKTQDDLDNDAKTRKWAMEDIARQAPYAQRAQIMAQMFSADQTNQTARAGQGVQSRGQDLNYDSGIRGQGVQSRGQDLNYQSAIAGQGVQARGQDMQAQTADTQSLRHLQGIDRQGNNTIANTALTGAQALEKERLTQQDPARLAMADSYNANASSIRDAAANAKLPHAQYMQELEQASKMLNAGEDPVRVKAFRDQADMRYNKARFAAEKNAKANGGPVGYASGGPIDVGGRLLDGAGDGKSDSLPAMIDDEHPAALSKGEFVMPIETVRHFGLDRLNKMVAASRKGLDAGRQQG